jgi:hypothetical protein
MNSCRSTEHLYMYTFVKELKTVLLHNGGFFNTCTMNRCLHRKVDFKTNALNNVHVSQLLHYKAELLQNGCIIMYVLADQNKLIAKIQVPEQYLS